MTDETLVPRMCPKWATCSVNLCPVDPLNPLRRTDNWDPEQSCPQNLGTRLEIVAKARRELGIVVPGAGLRPDERKRLEAGEKLEDLVAEWDDRTARRRARMVAATAVRDQRRGKASPADLPGSRADATAPGGPDTPPPAEPSTVDPKFLDGDDQEPQS